MVGAVADPDIPFNEMRLNAKGTVGGGGGGGGGLEGEN